jgi:hypothetical protein
MSAAWLNERNAPMLEWGLEAGDVYGAVMVMDLVSASARAAATVDHNAYFPVDDLGSIDDLMAFVTIPLSKGRTAPILGRVDIDPIAESERRLAALLAGAEPDVPREAAVAAVGAAREDKEYGGLGGRSLGFAIIRASDLYAGGDWQEFLVVVSDGERHAAIVARLSGSAVAVLAARGEDAGEHLLERLRNAVGTLPNDGHRYENVILNHPATYSGAP